MFPRLYRSDLVATAGLLAVAALACEPELVVGTRATLEATCSYDPGSAGAGPEDKVVEIGFTTGFESGDFCDYFRVGGSCYDTGVASHAIVGSPVHGGESAAAFSVTGGPDVSHTRCFLEGVLPTDAVYGAWFFVPRPAENVGNWNLMYIQGLVGPDPGLWDVSLSSADDGSLHLYIFSHTGQPLPPPDQGVVVPIGAWFEVEFRLLRATDATGAVALYQDGVLVQEATGIVTDAAEFDAEQWYVGNFADALTPPESTIYVDDVTVSAP